MVYGGFSTEALADRIEDAESRVLITCDHRPVFGDVIVGEDCIENLVEFRIVGPRELPGVSSRIESQSRYLMDYEIAALARCLKVSVAWLFGDKD